ncbi:hypothetical protein RB213_008417, partial [Colletotrichum asianum]
LNSVSNVEKPIRLTSAATSETNALNDQTGKSQKRPAPRHARMRSTPAALIRERHCMPSARVKAVKWRGGNTNTPTTPSRADPRPLFNMSRMSCWVIGEVGFAVFPVPRPWMCMTNSVRVGGLPPTLAMSSNEM